MPTTACLDSSAPTTAIRLRAAFFVLGIGALLPWNALINVLDYYTLRYPSVTVAHYITNVYTITFTSVGSVATLCPPPSRLRTSVVFWCYFGMMLISIAYPLGSASAFVVPLVLTGMLGAINAADESVMFSILALLHDKHMVCTTAYTVGFATAGLFVVALRISTRILFELDGYKTIDGANIEGVSIDAQLLKPGFVLFFCFCTVLCSACTLVVAWMYKRSDEYATHVLAYEFAEEESFASLHANNSPTSQTSDRVPLIERSSDVSGMPTLQYHRYIASNIRGEALSMFFCFFITLMLFPGIMTQIPVSLHPVLSATLASWYPLIVVGSFAFGDVIGRISWADSFAQSFPGLLPLVTAARIIIIPITVAQWTGQCRTSLVLTTATVFINGISNGFVMNVAYLIAPGRFQHPTQKETAGRVMFLANTWGLCAGAVCGALLQVLVNRIERSSIELLS